MRDDPGFGPRRRRPRLTAANIVVIVIVVALIVLLAWAQGPSGAGDGASSRGGWRLDRRLPMPGLLPSQTPSSSVATPGAPDQSARPVSPARPVEAFPLTVTHVLDGDTVEARIEDPNDVVRTTNPIRVRLIGIDTPEGAPSPECWADEARAHLAHLLPAGSTAWAAVDSDSWDDYDRLLVNMWTDDGLFVNHELVAAGDAETMRVWPNVAFVDLLAAAQTQAEASGAGRWGACG